MRNKSTNPANANHQREYSKQASVSIGIVHGIGAETGTQAILLAATVGATSALTGSFLLIAFVVGLLLSNTFITIAASSGLLGGHRYPKLHTGLGIFIAFFSLVLGSMFIMGMTQNLPSFFA
jgi:high-affinity nickel-transport protein